MRRFRWSWPDETEERARRGAEIASTLHIPQSLGEALASRGMDGSTSERIMQRPLKECTAAIGEPDGIEEAAATLADLGRKGRIGIICDYDVDGATAQAILVETLRTILPPGSKDPVVAVPYRNKEGFGPNTRCLSQLSEQGVDGVAVLDCGTSSGQLLDRFHEQFGILPVVVDHHPPHHQSPPNAGVIVNPWVTRRTDPGEMGSLCAAGLAWFLGRAILRQSGQSEADTVQVRKRITLLGALGTACDMMRIDTPFNRSLIRTGTRLMEDTSTIPPGLAALKETAGLTRVSSSDDFGWRIGPRINAGSRMGESDLAARCLREKSLPSALELARRLQDLNRRRVMLGREASQELDEAVGREALAEGPVNVHPVQAATPGTVGLVASSLVTRFGWPAIAVAQREDGLLAGSGRAALGFDLGSAVSAACQDGILVSGGGHAAACGVVLQPNRLEDLRQFLLSRFRALDPGDGNTLEPSHEIDALLHEEQLASEAMLQFAFAQRKLDPWGQGMQSPVVGIRGVTLATSNMTPTGHLFLHLVMGEARCSAVWWKAPADWTERIGLSGPRAGRSTNDIRIDLVGRIELDEWNGRRQGRFVVRDARATAA